MSVLKARLYELEMDKKRAEMEKHYGEKGDIGFGHQIRSYVFQPYQMVKDLRTGEQTSDVQAVMDGDLDTPSSRPSCAARSARMRTRTRSSRATCAYADPRSGSVGVFPAHARLGETESESIARYGPASALGCEHAGRSLRDHDLFDHAGFDNHRAISGIDRLLRGCAET